MKTDVLLINLEKLAKNLNIKIIQDKNLRNSGGFCRYQDRYYLILKSKLPDKIKINYYIKAIAKVLPEDYYVLPYIRELIEQERSAIINEQ